MKLLMNAMDEYDQLMSLEDEKLDGLQAGRKSNSEFLFSLSNCFGKTFVASLLTGLVHGTPDSPRGAEPAVPGEFYRNAYFL